MNFGVRYFVNHEKKVVVCKLYDCENALVCDMCHKGWPFHEALVINDSFVGKAKCSPDDVFDVEKGKELAYKRALIKLFRAKANAATRFLKGNQDFVNELSLSINNLVDKYDKTVSKKESDIASMF